MRRSTGILAATAASLMMQIPSALMAQVPPSGVSEAVEAVVSVDAERIAGVAAALELQDIVRQEITVCIDPDAAWMEADSRMWIESSAEGVRLVLDPDLSVTSVSDSRGHELRYARRSEILDVWSQDGSEAFPLEIVIQYHGEIAGSTGAWEAGDVVIGEGLVLFGSGFAWYPTSESTDTARLRIEARYPQGYSSVATGMLAGMAPSLPANDRCSEGDVWEVPTPVTGACLAVGRFESSLTVLGDVFVGSHRATEEGRDPVRPPGWGNQRLPVEDLTELLRFLEACNGPYPYEWLNVVVVPGGGGETLSGPGFVAVGHERGAPGVPSVSAGVAAAAGESWWGFWIEPGHLIRAGIAAKTATDWLEATGDGDGAARLRESRRWQFMGALHRSGGSVSLFDCLSGDAGIDDLVCVGRGCALFDMLSYLTGQDVYCAALNRLSDERGGSVTGIEDLIRAFEVESGSNLDWFFYEWMARDDLPSYALEYEIVEGERGRLVARGSILQEGKFYRTPLPLTIDLGGWSYEEIVPIASPHQPFEITVDERPVAITIDERRIIPRVDRSERARMHFERGSVAVEANDWKDAVDEFGSAVSLDPESASYSRSYGIALVRAGWGNEGLAQLEDAVSLDPDGNDSRLELARLYIRSGNHAAALDHLDTILEGSSAGSEVEIERAAALVGLGRLDEAERSIEGVREALAEEPARPGLLGNLFYVSGLLAEARGDSESAMREYEAALAEEPVLDEPRRRLRALRLGQ